MNQQVSNVTAETIRRLVSASETAAVVVSDMENAGVGILAGCDGMVLGFCIQIGSGTIYVLRSRSLHPFIAEHRELIHKVGVTGGNVEDRLAGAEKDATYC